MSSNNNLLLSTRDEDDHAMLIFPPCECAIAMASFMYRLVVSKRFINLHSQAIMASSWLCTYNEYSLLQSWLFTGSFTLREQLKKRVSKIQSIQEDCMRTHFTPVSFISHAARLIEWWSFFTRLVTITETNDVKRSYLQFYYLRNRLAKWTKCKGANLAVKSVWKTKLQRKLQLHICLFSFHTTD